MAEHIKSINGYPIVMNNAAYFGVSSTGASTAAKVVTCGNMQTLDANATITVRFTAANTTAGALTMNVNSTGAKPVYVNGAATSATNLLLWATGAVITFVYDGTNWVVASEPRCWYGTCSTAAGTAGKTANVGGFVACAGTRLTLAMTSANTSTSATLNVSSTSARSIYHGASSEVPTTANGYGWAAGDTVDLVFDGQYWRTADTVALTKLRG